MISFKFFVKMELNFFCQIGKILRCSLGLIIVCVFFSAKINAQDVDEDSGESEEVTDEQKKTHPELIKKIPKYLFKDEHYREEFGINEFTTPSIKEIFNLLEAVGDVSYEDLKRHGSQSPPRDRVMIALSLGTIIAEGFLIIHAEKYKDLEGVARDIIDHTHLLGASKRVKNHARELSNKIIQGDKDNLKKELAATQQDVEEEMLLLRDVEIAHLVSLGGWIRAFEITCDTIHADYSREKTKVLGNSELPAYYAFELSSLQNKIGKHLYYQDLVDQMRKITRILKNSPDGTYSKEQVNKLRIIAKELIKVVNQKKTAA